MTKPNIYERINAVMREVKGVEKSSHNQHGGYKYAGHESVTEAIRPALVKHGIVQTVNVTGLELLPGGHMTMIVHVVWTCSDNPESYIQSSIPALQHCQTKGGNPTAQQVGQAISYAVKNFTFKTLMLTGDPDSDSDVGPLESPRDSPREAPRGGTAAIPEAVQGFLSRYAAATGLGEINAVAADIKKWSDSPDFGSHRDKLAQAMYAARRRLAP